jgi:hypothetical protein
MIANYEALNQNNQDTVNKVLVMIYVLHQLYRNFIIEKSCFGLGINFYYAEAKHKFE